MKLARLGLVSAFLGIAASTSPALAWWQFVSLGPDGQRQVHSPYKNESTCQAALKKVEDRMKKQFPNQFPLVGSCEEYQNKK